MALAVLALGGCGSSSTKTVTVTGSTPASTSAPSSTATRAPVTRQTTTPAPATVVLGAASFAPNGDGFGTAQPADIFNGGDPSGHVSQIHWSGWGSATAVGTGMSSIFKPQGGYYPQLVPVRLRADQLGSCTAGGPAAYTHLSVREPSVPGGPLGPWMGWSGSGSICSAP